MTPSLRTPVGLAALAALTFSAGPSFGQGLRPRGGGSSPPPRPQSQPQFRPQPQPRPVSIPPRPVAPLPRPQLPSLPRTIAQPRPQTASPVITRPQTVERQTTTSGKVAPPALPKLPTTANPKPVLPKLPTVVNPKPAVVRPGPTPLARPDPKTPKLPTAPLGRVLTARPATPLPAPVRRESQDRARTQVFDRAREAASRAARDAKLPPDQLRRLQGVRTRQTQFEARAKEQALSARQQTLRPLHLPAGGAKGGVLKVDKGVGPKAVPWAGGKAGGLIDAPAYHGNSPLGAALGQSLKARPLSFAHKVAVSGRVDALLGKPFRSPADCKELRVLHRVLCEDRCVCRRDLFCHLIRRCNGGGTVVLPPPVYVSAPVCPGFVSYAPCVSYPPAVVGGPATYCQVIPASLPEPVVDDPPAEQGEPGPDAVEPNFLVSPDAGLVVQTTRYVRLSNGTGERVTFSFQVRTQVEDGSFAWVPGPEKEPMTVSLEPGEVADLEDHGWRVHADEVVIRGQTETKEWTFGSSEEPLRLVPEVDADGNHGYEAADRDTVVLAVK